LAEVDNLLLALSIIEEGNFEVADYIDIHIVEDRYYSGDQVADLQDWKEETADRELLDCSSLYNYI